MTINTRLLKRRFVCLLALTGTVLLVLSLAACPGSNSAPPVPGPAPIVFPAPPANLYDFSMLGAEYSAGDSVSFSVFAPRARAVSLKIAGDDDVAMTKDVYGIWRVTRPDTPVGTRYRYSVDGTLASDPYGKAWSWQDWQGGGWSIVVDPADFSWTDADWEIPSIDELVIYELHLKDISSHATSADIGVAVDAIRGKYAGISAAIPYFQELGVNALEFMPISEFNDGGYSWGYNTQSFFAPESGFAVDLSDGYPTGSQVAEFQQMVDDLHGAGIAVIVDMVYNHVGNAQNSFWAIDNIYYFDYNNNGTTSDDGTPWGNHVASWRPMVKKLMYDNLRYFIEYLHVDGFRFDATSYMDHNALKEVVAALKVEFPDVIFIAEQLPNSANFKGTGIAQWSDPFHDTMKALLRMGTYQGNAYNSSNLGKITYYTKDDNWSANPLETINYFESHDENSVLFEVLTNTGKTIEDARKSTKLGALHLFTALGTPMLMAGQEFLKNREGQNLNETNGQIDWSWYLGADVAALWSQDVFTYYQGLIALRKAYPSLRLTGSDPASVGAFRWSVTPGAWGNLGYPYTNGGDLVIGYALNANASVGSVQWVVVLNYATTDKTDLEIVFPAGGNWYLIADGDVVHRDAPPVTVTPTGDDAAGWKVTRTVPARTGLLFAKGLVF